MAQHPSEKIMAQLIENQWQKHSIYAAIIDEKLQVVATGRTTVGEDHDPTAHAEVNAIRAACQKLGVAKLPAGYWLYTTFEPCPLCASAAVWAGVTGVVYANDPRYRGTEDNWSFIACRDVLQKGRDIHPVALVENFMLEEIKGYFLRHQ